MLEDVALQEQLELLLVKLVPLSVTMVLRKPNFANNVFYSLIMALNKMVGVQAASIQLE